MWSILRCKKNTRRRGISVLERPGSINLLMAAFATCVPSVRLAQAIQLSADRSLQISKAKQKFCHEIWLYVFLFSFPMNLCEVAKAILGFLLISLVHFQLALPPKCSGWHTLVSSLPLYPHDNSEEVDSVCESVGGKGHLRSFMANWNLCLSGPNPAKCAPPCRLPCV